MELLTQLFSDWVGILSISTIVFILGMAVFIGIYVMRHVHQEEQMPAHATHRGAGRRSAR